MRPVLYVIALLCFSFAATGQPYKYLVLKGGGIRGIAYIGAIKALEECKAADKIEKVAGTSAGAITGTLFAFGYSAAEMERIMLGLNISTFNDGGWFFIGGQKRLRKNYGWYIGRKLEEWIEEKTSDKTGIAHITFLQLHHLVATGKKYKDLYITATNLTKQRPEVFSWETTPDLPVAAAVRASAAIPLYYGAVFMDSAGQMTIHPDNDSRYNVYVDGGLLANTVSTSISGMIFVINWYG